MHSNLRIGAIAVLTAWAAPALAQKPLIGPDQPCTAAFENVGYPVLTRFVPGDVPAPARAGIRGVVARAITWRPGETIKVCFRSGTQKARVRIAAFAAAWMQYANIVLDFGDRADPRMCAGDNSEGIKIDFVPNSGYWSQLGTNSKRVGHSMNLGDMGKDDLPFPAAEARRLTLHEFGHALGLLHEHQSPKSGCGAEYFEEALLAYGALLGWSREKALGNFIPYAESVELNATEVDRKSIMHYSLPPWLFKAGQSSPCFVQPNFEISEGDKAFMARVYPKPEVLATRGATQVSAEKRRQALINEYRTQLQQAGVEKSKLEKLVKDFSATVPTN